jgi:MarR family transcriptional regulator, lower aerobic nicotinate degradation pathway regulator
MNYIFLQNLLPLIGEFQQQINWSEPSARQFAEWILQQEEQHEFQTLTQEKGESYPELAAMQVGNSRCIVNLYRYAKSYARKAIPSDSPITFDDYSYLVILFYRGAMTKMQLIEENIHEKSTGMEVIKRLLRLGLLVQTANEADKRSKIVMLSDYGKQAMQAIQHKMYDLTMQVNGNLTPSEMSSLFHLLQKLDNYHREIWNSSQ